jgi:valyl-tRNA synthetase
MNNFPSQYNPLAIEQKWKKFWQEHDVYKWDENVAKEDSFVIDTPPPTVSGSLHMGHVFSYSQADFVARYQRMKGKNVFYPMGFDDNGLPTERLVEKVKKVRAVHMERREFQKLCYEVVEEAEEEFYNLFNSIALSIDWSQKYQTISPESTKISQLSFLDLFAKNHVYRKLQPTLWDPIDRTALAQADVVDSEIAGKMYNIAFATEEGEQLVIATTRPELLGACVAIFFNEEDLRYQHLTNKYAVSPIFGVKVPIISDKTVDMEKGTGLVMCCTFGDITDVDWWRKHNLPTRIILDQAGKLSLKDKFNDENFSFKDTALLNRTLYELDGLKANDAREKIIEILRNENLVLTEQEVIKNVKCAERSGSPLEILVTPQWFIKILDKKQQFLEKSAECNWFPKYMKVRLDNWIEGLSWDWCISRQRFFGVPIPVWYSKRLGEEGKVIVPRQQDLPVDPLVDLPHGYSKDEVTGDSDVMDTWATSSVTPQINSHAINKDYAIDLKRHHKLFPADLRPQAHEIIRTWTFYTIVKACLHENSIPWKNLMMSGWCLAADKTKMSKSKGNVVTPINLIEEKGADIVRYWASTSKLGADIAYSEEVFKIGKKLVTKIWNASKFVAQHIYDLDFEKLDINQITHTSDLWILSKLQQAVKKATKEFEEFEYCNARVAIEDFFWKDFCDNYLEIVKVRIYNEEKLDLKGQESAKTTVAFMLEIILRLFAPFIPYVTEELYSIIFGEKHGSIHKKNTWPSYSLIPYDDNYEQVGNDIVEILDVVRRVKAEKQLSLKVPIEKIVIKSLADKNIIDLPEVINDLKNVTNAKHIEFIKDEDYVLDLTTQNNKYNLQIYFNLSE